MRLSRRASCRIEPLSIEDVRGELIVTLFQPLTATLEEIKEQLGRMDEKLSFMKGPDCIEHGFAAQPREKSPLLYKASSMLPLPLPDVSTITALPAKSAQAAFTAGTFMKDMTNSGFDFLFKRKSNPSAEADIPPLGHTYSLLKPGDKECVFDAPVEEEQAKPPLRQISPPGPLSSNRRSSLILDLVTGETGSESIYTYSRRTSCRAEAGPERLLVTEDDDATPNDTPELSHADMAVPSTPQLKTTSNRYESGIRHYAEYLGHDTKNLHGIKHQDGGFLFFRSIANSLWFNYVAGTIILVSALSIGLQIDYMARRGTTITPESFAILDLILCILFVMELCIRIGSRGIKLCTSAKMFDFVCTCCFILETMVAWIPALRFVFQWLHGVFVFARVSRLARLMRFFKLLDMFPELRMLWSSLVQSIRSLVWTCFLILGIVYISAVYLTSVVTMAKVTNADIGQEAGDELERYFGTLDRTMLSLYQCMSEGLHWAELATPLQKNCSPWAAIFFSLYMAFVVFAIMNVITAHLCEHAVKLGKRQTQERFVYEMRKLFDHSNYERDSLPDVKRGEFTMDQFQDKLQTSQVQDFLKAFELTEQDAMKLFHVLRDEESESIPVSAFVQGCTRINGPAKATDVVQMMKQWHMFAEHLDVNMQRHIGDINLQINKLLHSTSSRTFEKASRDQDKTPRSSRSASSSRRARKEGSGCNSDEENN